jgi:YD repeat-containing protein
MTYANGIYTRYLPHGAKVNFNTQFRHIETVDRLGKSTYFGYDAQGRLSSIAIPPEVVTSTNPLTLGYFHSYSFAYSTNLVTVTANSPGLARRDSIKLSSGRVTRLTDPDTTFVDFTYHGSTRRVATRADRRGHVTAFAFDDAGKLVRSSTALSAGDSIVTLFRPAESFGFASNGLPTPLHPDAVYTRLDGPRPAPVYDTTAFWLDGFGAPRKIANALGQVTKLSRRDTRWPAQVTRLERTNGAVTLAEYDTLGRVSKTIATNQLDDNRHAITR